MLFSSTVRTHFEAAGWYEGRNVPVAADIPKQHPAYAILAELSGLRVGSGGSGIDCATSDIEFGEPVIEEDWHEITVWQGLLDTKLVGLAEYHRGHGGLLIATSGKCFSFSLGHEDFSFEGHTFEEAVERILLGRKSRPMLRPDQDSVEIYGVSYARGHPDIYEY